MSTAAKGNAAFKYTPSGGSETTLSLTRLLRDLEPTVIPNVRTWWSADGVSRNDVAVGSAIYDLTATIRYEGDPQALLSMLSYAAAGTQLTYYPEKYAPSTNYPCYLVNAGEVALAPDRATWFRAEYEVTVRLRRTDGGTWEDLLLASAVTATYTAYEYDVWDTDSPDGFWPVDEGAAGTARDLSGNSLPGTLTGTTIAAGTNLVTGGPGSTDLGTASPDGYLELTAASFDFRATAYTVEMWVKDLPEDGTLFASHNGDVGATRAWVRLWIDVSTGDLNLEVQNTDTTITTCTASAALGAGSTGTFHVAIRYDRDDSNKGSIWVNGSKVGGDTTLPDVDAVPNYCRFGCHGYPTASDFTGGEYQEAAIWIGTALSDARIAAHYAAGS